MAIMKKIHAWFISLVFIVLGCTQQTSAQTKTLINGTIVDSASKEPVGFATIGLKTGKDSLVKTTISKADGSFKFENVKPVTYHLVFVSAEYERKMIDIDLTNTAEVNLGVLPLTHETKNLKEVEVTADRPIVELKADRIIYDMQADPESKVTSVSGMIHKIPFLSLDADDNLLLKGNSSFKVLINGKESGVFTNNLKEILKSMPASSVMRIEVITIPPAKYDAEGLTGIINIITNRKIVGGYKGNFNVYERFPNGGPGAGGSFTAQDGRFGINAFVGGSTYTNPQTTYDNMRATTGTDASILQQAGTNSGNGKNGYFGTELSYEIDTLNLLTGNFNISGRRHNGYTCQNSLLNSTDGTSLQGYDLDNNNHSTGGDFDAAMNYQLGFHSDKNTLLTISYRYSQHSSNTSTNIDISNPLDYTTPDYQQPDKENSREQTVQVDYTRPLHKIKMEAGVKAIFRNSSSDFEYLSFDSTNDQFENEASMGNTFSYVQDVFGGYNSYQFSLKKWNFSAGLRAEETYVHANFISTDTFLNRTYFNILPSIAINHQYSGNRALSLGFTQRIQRPGINQLNPFVDRADPDFISSGNPKLVPVVMNNIQVGYNTTIAKKVSLFIAATYTFFNNLILQSTLFDPSTQITTTTYENAGKGGGVGLNLNLNYSAAKFYNLSLNGNVMQFFVDGTGDVAADRMDMLAGHVSLSNGFKLDGGWSATLNGDYQSRAPHSLQAVSNAYFSSSLSVSRQFVARKLAVSASVNNPFTKFRYNLTTTTSPDFLQVDENQKYFRYVNFSLNYNFGKLKSGIKKNRKGINNDDVGGGNL
jgi:ferric enterobactin receptor